MAAPLPSHALVLAPSSTPTQLVLFLHGILGRGNNWRGFARSLVQAKPAWGAVLVDLRAHGESLDLPPPDGLDAAADDIARLVDTLALPVRAVLGHSFGGKVAVALLEKIALQRLFVVDSMPGARKDRRGSESTLEVITMLRELPDRFDSREKFVEHVLAQGRGPTLAKWLAQNLERETDGYRFALDMDRIERLMNDYFERDLWPLLDPPPAGTIAHIVIGGLSSVYSEDDRVHARELASRHPEAVQVHVLEKADHWVHVDDPEGLSTIVRAAL